MWQSALLIPEAVFFLYCPLPLSVVQKKSDKSHTGHTWNRISDTVLQSLAFDTSGWKWWVHVALVHDSVSAALPFSSFSLVRRFRPQGPLLICVTRSYAQSTSVTLALCVFWHMLIIFFFQFFCFCRFSVVPLQGIKDQYYGFSGWAFWVFVLVFFPPLIQAAKACHLLYLSSPVWLRK